MQRPLTLFSALSIAPKNTDQQGKEWSRAGNRGVAYFLGRGPKVLRILKYIQ